MTQSGTADYTVNGTSYFTDDQIQTYLDENRKDYLFVPLNLVSEIDSNGSAIYQRYYMPDQANWIERVGDDSLFRIYASAGNSPGTAEYTVNYDGQFIEFSSSTGGSAYYLDFSHYNLYRTAANMWEHKAGLVAAGAVDWASDNHRVSQSKQIDNYMMMSRKYRDLAGPMIARRVRTDER